MPVPDVPLEKHPPRTLLYVIMVAITAYTPHSQEAWTVLKALNFDDPAWKVPDPKIGGLPTLPGRLRPRGGAALYRPRSAGSGGKEWLGWPGHPAITEIQRHISVTVNRAMTGVMTPREALDHAAAQVDELLADY